MTPRGHSERPSFLVGVLSTGIGTLLPMVFSFAGILFVVRAIDQADYGVYLLLVVILQCVSTMSELGLGTSTIRSMQMLERDDRDDLVNSVLGAATIFLVIVSILAVAARPLYFHIYHYPLLLDLVLYLPPLLILTNLNSLLSAVLQGCHWYGMLARVRIMTGALRLGVMLAFVLGLHTGVRGLIYADVVAMSVSVAWTYAVIPIRRRLVMRRDLLRSTLRFGFPLYLNSLLYFAYNRVDVLMIGYLISSAGVASCDVAERIPNNLKLVFTSSFVTVFFPKMSELFGRSDPSRAQELMNMSLRVMGFITLCVAAVVLLFREELTVLLYSETYREAALAFALFMVAMCIGLMGTIMGNTLVAAGYSSAPVKINLVAITSNVLGNLLMIPLLGFTGAAWATLLMVCATLPVNQWYLRRKGYHVHGWDYLTPLAFLVAIGLLALLPGLSSWWVRGLLLLAYPTACMTVSPPLREDLLRAWGQVGETVRARFARQPSS